MLCMCRIWCVYIYIGIYLSIYVFIYRVYKLYNKYVYIYIYKHYIKMHILYAFYLTHLAHGFQQDWSCSTIFGMMIPTCGCRWCYVYILISLKGSGITTCSSGMFGLNIYIYIICIYIYIYIFVAGTELQSRDAGEIHH